MDRVVDHCREAIRLGSKSFAGAARLLPRDTRHSVYMLYAWCRHCDDRIDLQDLGRGRPSDASQAEGRLAELEEETRRTLAGGTPSLPVFVGLQRVVRKHGIPHAVPLELLRGFAMDVEGRLYRSLEDTLEYCYHVAGVVGVMMAHVMDAADPEALDRASDLGIALQMTNIARDVLDDASAGRVYLPQEWLTEAGIPQDGIGRREHRDALADVVRRFLEEADRYYASASCGLRHLDPRCAWAVAVARDVYREIGRVVLERGAAAWDRRAIVPKRRKLELAVRTAPEAFRSIVPPSGRDAPRDGLWTRRQP